MKKYTLSVAGFIGGLFMAAIVIIDLALTTLLMVGCTESRNEFNTTENNGKLSFYRTIMVDSCEYVDAYHQLAHKGNCKYCAERRKREIKELVEQLKEK